MKFMTLKLASAMVATAIMTCSAAFVGIEQVAADNVVYISSATEFCMIMPKFPHMNIGDSEYPGGTQTFCTYPYNPALQGTIPQNFFNPGQVAVVNGVGVNGRPFIQITGCINPSTIDRLNPADAGGQYDSAGGITLQGNPIGSACLGYDSYVEIIEPAGPRACLRCCFDPADCPVNMDTSGCVAVVPGNYFTCGY